MLFCGYLLTAFIIFEQHFCAADQSSVPEAPTLTQTSVSGSTVKLLCQAPPGYGGLEFKLFKVRQQVDAVKYTSKQQEAHFVLRGTDTDKENLYCCQYENSMYSSYITPVLISRASVRPPPSPYLVVEPSSEHVVRGQTLSFHCQAPPASLNQPPEMFLLIQRAKGTPGSILTPPKLVSQSRQAHFSVRTMGREDSGEYVCLYQLTLLKTGQVNSSASQPVQITVIDLPDPTLTLSKQGGDFLECVGSPSYPRALFSLFRVGSLSPEATLQLPGTQHSARFPIPTRYEHDSLYQCQYSVQLDNSHLYSKMSVPISLPCMKGNDCSSPSAGDTGRADLALIVGSVSAGVLFLMAVSLLSFALHRHFRTLTQRRRKREQEKLWQQIHSRDHVIDLTLPRVDCDHEQDVVPAFRGRPSMSEPIYDSPLKTFSPTHC